MASISIVDSQLRSIATISRGRSDMAERPSWKDSVIPESENVMWLRNPALIILALGLLVLPGCTGSEFPIEALEGVASPRIAFTVWERTMPASEGGSTIEIVEVRRVDDQLERRVVVHLPDGQHYLGPLVPLRDNVPVELLLADVAGQAVLIGWVNRSVVGEPAVIELRRAVDGTDARVAATKTGATDGRGFALPIGADETASWLQLEQINVLAWPASADGDTTVAPDTVVEATFDPPLFIGARFLGMQ